MRTILEIVTFHTPIDSIVFTESKEQQIRAMIEDFLQNSGEQFERIDSRTDTYETSRYSHKNVILTIQIKQDNRMQNYLIPHCNITVEMEDSQLEKELVEDFLNTIIRFFSGTLTQEYFLDYDSIYRIETMNQGKKYSIDDIKNLDTKNIQDTKNKNLLDSILYLHYTLEKKILLLGIEQRDLNNFLEKNTESETIKNVLLVSKERTNITIVNLFANIQIIHRQIQIILGYFIYNS